MSDKNPYEDAAATLHLPMDEDVPIVREMLQSEFEAIETEYAMVPEEPKNERQEHIMQKGSLLQELLAQLNNQG